MSPVAGIVTYPGLSFAMPRGWLRTASPGS
jgi:hypothetical protein